MNPCRVSGGGRGVEQVELTKPWKTVEAPGGKPALVDLEGGDAGTTSAQTIPLPTSRPDGGGKLRRRIGLEGLAGRPRRLPPLPKGRTVYQKSFPTGLFRIHSRPGYWGGKPDGGECGTHSPSPGARGRCGGAGSWVHPDPPQWCLRSS